LSLFQAQLHFTETEGLEDKKCLTELSAKLKLGKYEGIIFYLHLASVGARGSIVVKAL
jgi:hypothetical protein